MPEEKNWKEYLHANLAIKCGKYDQNEDYFITLCYVEASGTKVKISKKASVASKKRKSTLIVSFSSFEATSTSLFTYIRLHSHCKLKFIITYSSIFKYFHKHLN